MAKANSSLIDLTGQRFNRLVVVSFNSMQKRSKASWLVHCDCGTEFVVRGDSLTTGNTKSCGCLKLEKVTKHGHSQIGGKVHSITYTSWQSMLARCRNPSSSHYKRYGGAGITVCECWLSFENFLADMGERPVGTTLDRINNDQGYELSNCRWATAKQQSWNRRNGRMLTHAGQTLCVGEWAEAVGIPRMVLQDRIRLGWSDERILTTPYTPRLSKGQQISRKI